MCCKIEEKVARVLLFGLLMRPVVYSQGGLDCSAAGLNLRVHAGWVPSGQGGFDVVVCWGFGT